MVHTMSLSQYLEMWNRIIKWQNDNNTTRLPNYVDVGDMNVGVNPIYKDTYMDMYNRVVAYQGSHGGEMPQVIGIEGSASNTEPVTPTGSIKSKLEAGLGSFNNFTQFWQKILGRGYSHYYNDIYTLDQEIDRLIKKTGLNCTDSMQLCYALGTEMGYEMKYVQVQCNEGGHIRGQIKGKEFGDWTRIDPAAAIDLNSQYPIGKVWCDYDNAHVDTDNWLVVDDGQ